MNRPGVGVAIGRFQVHDLHEGHLALISRAAEHSKLVVFICVCPHLVTPDDPLDYAARELMVRERFPRALTLPLVDSPTDEGWSGAVDTWLASVHPTDAATIYFGRDSSIARYHGRCKSQEIDPVPHVSATDIRAQVGKRPELSSAWRAGFIYAASNSWPRAVPVVDVCITRNGSAETEVLIGRRANERGKNRFPGGHVNISDLTAEAAARREASEETGVEVADMKIIGNYRVRSWRDSRGYALFTTLFHATYVSGPAHGADDLDDVRWVPISELLSLKFADDHEMLAVQLLEYLSKKGK